MWSDFFGYILWCVTSLVITGLRSNYSEVNTADKNCTFVTLQWLNGQCVVLMFVHDILLVGSQKLADPVIRKPRKKVATFSDGCFGRIYSDRDLYKGRAAFCMYWLHSKVRIQQFFFFEPCCVFTLG